MVITKELQELVNQLYTEIDGIQKSPDFNARVLSGDFGFLKSFFERFSKIEELFKDPMGTGELWEQLNKAIDTDDKEFLKTFLIHVNVYGVHAVLSYLFQNAPVAVKRDIAPMVNPLSMFLKRKDGKAPEFIIDIINESQYERITDLSQVNTDNFNEDANRVFTPVKPESSEYIKFIEKYEAVQRGECTVLDWLGPTASLVLIFDEIEPGKFTVNFTCGPINVKQYVQDFMVQKHYFYNTENAVFQSGFTVDTSVMTPFHSEVMSNLYQVLVGFEYLYVANTDTLYVNNFRRETLLAEAAAANPMSEPLTTVMS